MQENITETVTQTIWGAIKSFLDLGFTLGSGNQEVRIDCLDLAFGDTFFCCRTAFFKMDSGATHPKHAGAR